MARPPGFGDPGRFRPREAPFAESGLLPAGTSEAEGLRRDQALRSEAPAPPAAPIGAPAPLAAPIGAQVSVVAPIGVPSAASVAVPSAAPTPALASDLSAMMADRMLVLVGPAGADLGAALAAARAALPEGIRLEERSAEPADA